MTPEDACLLYEYNSWANRRVLDACAALTQEQFTRTIPSSFPSVHRTLSHILGGQEIWFERWRGRSLSKIFSPEEVPDIAAMRARWEKHDRELLAFVGGLSAEDLARVHNYTNTRGATFSSPMWQMLQHVANHSTYHRGQVTMMLRQLDAAPLLTDLIAFYRERAGQPHN